MTRPLGHIVVLHRWHDRHAHYADYLDHDAHRVSYVTTRLGRASVPPGAAAVAEVAVTDSLAETRAAVTELIELLGPVRRLVALNEGDLDTAAALRTEFGLPGQDAAELERFRDKLTMVTLVDRAGIAVPRFADAVNREAVREFAEDNGWPVVVKPRRGTASRGVSVLRDPADLDTCGLFDAAPAEPLIVQSFVADPVFHIDGLWTGTRLGPWRASRYINSCRDFTDGTFLGSVEVDDPELRSPLTHFTAAVAEALGEGQPWVFHMEAFVGPGHDGVPRLTFLEAGARVGGGEIPFVWREVHGLDLMAAAVDIQLDRPPTLPAAPVAHTVSDVSTGEHDGHRGGTAGWLLLPVPVEAPCRVVGVTHSPDAAGPGTGPYAQVVPEPGSVIPRTGGYEHVAARFRFRGASSHEVEAAIKKTSGAFTVRCEALPV